MMTPPSTVHVSQPETETLSASRASRRGEERSRFPLAAALSVLAHALLVVGLSSASAPVERSRPRTLPSEWVTLPPAEPVEEPPPPPEPVKQAVALPVRPPRPAVRERERQAPKPAEPDPQAEPEQASAPAPSTPEPAAEPAVSETLSVDAPEAEPSAAVQAGSAGGGAGVGVGRAGATAGAGASSGQGNGPSEADRRRAQSRYVHALQGLIGAHARYPRAAMRAGLEGRVVLGLRILPDGRLIGVRIAASSGHDLLDEAALEAAREVDRLPAPPALAVLDPKDEVRVGVVYVVR